MDIQFVKASMDAPVFEDGTKLFQAGHVQSFESETDDQLTTITAMVKDNRSDKVFEARIITGDKWIVDTECECRSFHITGKPCRHIAAALIYALEHQEVKEEEKKSDPAIEDFITSYANAASRPKNLPSSPLVVDAHLSMGENHDIKAEFRLGLPGRRKFIIQQISDFANAMNHESERKYGNTLSFTHCLDAFAPEYRGLVRMLRALDSSTDSYLADDDPFYTRSALSNGRQYIHRRMSIRGRYSDMFFECLKHLPFYYFDGKEENEYTISEDKPELSFSLEKEEPGYSFSCRIPPFFIGERNLYFLNTQKHTIEILPNTSADIPALFAGLSAVNEKSFYIAPNELSLFSRNIFPLMKELMNSDTDFNPEDYAPAKPKFEIYLDMPEEDTVTGEMYAIYPNDKYNALGKTHDSLTRDIIAESDMKEFFVNWFNNFDRDKKIAILKEDEDALYSLIKNGIPAMQEKASVFISDAMKKMNVIKVSHISVGVSVTQNLLRLDLVQDTLTRKQLAELLSRYDRKKKFYRLKDGTFIDMDDSLRKLGSLTESLDLSEKDLEQEVIELPKFRALYLDEFGEDGDLDLEYSEKFKELVWQMRSDAEKQYTLPEGLKADLRPYQEEGFRWLLRLHDNGFAGLLADEMGLGKTVQVIAFLGALENRGRTLIVTPASLVYNWMSEIRRFFPSLPAVMITGTAPEREALIAGCREDDIMITSYDLLKRDIEFYKDMAFGVQIIDEAQYIKNAGTQASQAVKTIRSDFKIALTGTPIENRLSELWSIFDYLMPGYLFSYRRFRSLYEIPIVREEDEDSSHELQHMISSFVLRRVKKDVLKDLPDKLEKVFYAPLEGEQKELYNARVQSLKADLLGKTDKEYMENRIQILAELTRLRQICCDPDLLYNDYQGNSAKTDLCIEMVKTSVESGHKVLLFSQFTTMLDILNKRLEEEQIPYHLITGATPKSKRAEMVESFQHDDVPVFCISLKAGGTGVNLTAADVVIHYDPWWNTAVENQASDRAHRIGQKNVVSVFRLIMSNSIEERILALQQEKSGLFQRILSDQSISSAALSKEDLIKLLE